VSLIRICRKFGKSRAAYYKHVRLEQQMAMESSIVHELVMANRLHMPRLGGRKLYYLIKEELMAHNIKLGRDLFFEWLSKHDLLVRPKKSFTKTTNSLHRFRVHKNLIKGTTATRCDQIWVSDITYLRTKRGFCYLALITDAYSRKIVGYDVSDSLELDGCMRALKQACKQRVGSQTIHHSDRGIQYCSNRYTLWLRKEGIEISMAEAGNCYENAMAERVNGILKNELNLDAIFESVEHAQKAAKQAVQTYNTKRPHMAIGFKKPIELYAA
jgi:transposase InsO family protein